jgi:uncharacterized membrane protein SpoIIM required for sporulation/ABC-type transport system involved in multi-copper enzyme maturation permease subunit
MKNRQANSMTTLGVNRIQERRSTFSNALIITRREVMDSFRDWRILAPIVILTFLFPSLAQFLAGRLTSFVAEYGAQIIGERTIPFMLMIVGFFPISISLVIALETFVGEKERRSLEPLLSTPLTNTELYIGKTLAAMIPPLVASYGGMTVYLTGLLFGELAWRPQAMLIVQIILLTTVQALVMVTGAVVVSSQATSTRAANLLASFIIIPMTLAINGESAIMFIAPDAASPNGIGALWAIIFGMVVAVILLLRVGNSIFNREELLGRTIDEINLKSIARGLWARIIAVNAEGAPAKNLWHWYTQGIPHSLRSLGAATPITIGVFLVFFVGGGVVGLLPEWRLPLPEISESRAPADVLGRYVGVAGAQINDESAFITPTAAAAFAFQNNARILIGALLLGMFTFGVGGLILTPAVYVVLGYIFVQVLLAGWNPAFIFAAVLPHGVIEIPMIVIATAASLRLGAVITRPPNGMTVGGGWTMAAGNALKLMLGVVLPGLLIAALLEAFVTPLVVVAVLGG